jgi:pimeloyl-ACP methyl ester carboxylesterase
VSELGYHTTGGPGGEPPVVLMHSLGDTAKTWSAFAARLPQRTIALDLPGHGTSPWSEEYSFTGMADDVLSFLDEHGHGEIDLVGHSLGGAVAQHIAMREPQRVRRMVVEDIAPPPHEPVTFEMPARPAEPIDFDWAVVGQIKRLVRTPDPAWWAGLARITAETLWLAGGPPSHVDQDRLRAAAARLPSVHVVEIPVGHNIHRDAPDEFAAAVVPFLTRAGR